MMMIATRATTRAGQKKKSINNNRSVQILRSFHVCRVCRADMSKRRSPTPNAYGRSAKSLTRRLVAEQMKDEAWCQAFLDTGLIDGVEDAAGLLELRARLAALTIPALIAFAHGKYSGDKAIEMALGGKKRGRKPGKIESAQNEAHADVMDELDQLDIGAMMVVDGTDGTDGKGIDEDDVEDDVLDDVLDDDEVDEFTYLRATDVDIADLQMLLDDIESADTESAESKKLVAEV